MPRVSQLRGSPESMTTTLCRYRASQSAADKPAGPPPTTATSKRSDAMRRRGAKSEPEFETRRDGPAVRVRGQPAANTHSCFETAGQLAGSSRKKLMDLMAGCVELVDRSEHRVILESNAFVVIEQVAEAGTRLELPLALIPGQAALERWIHDQRN